VAQKGIGLQGKTGKVKCMKGNTLLTTRSELKRIAEELLECNENAEIEQEYKKALCYLDLESIKFFQSMGEDVRQQVLNTNDYRHGLKFGFTEIKFNEDGWLQDCEWVKYEEVEIKVCKKQDKNFTGNIVKLAMGINKMWTFSVKYQLGSGSGGSWSPNVFGECFDSMEKAYRAGIDYIYSKHTDSLTERDGINNCHDYNKKVLCWIKENVKTDKQLQLF
jgi:hypothetical protein